VNKGTFPNPHESLRLGLSFKRMDFKTFVIVCSFAVRLNELGSAVKSTIEKLQVSSMRDQLLKAKVGNRQVRYLSHLHVITGALLLPHGRFKHRCGSFNPSSYKGIGIISAD
jgi:hypothetical protein